MLGLVRYLFVIRTSVIDCLGRFIPEMTYYVSSGTINLAQLNSTLYVVIGMTFCIGLGFGGELRAGSISHFFIDLHCRP